MVTKSTRWTRTIYFSGNEPGAASHFPPPYEMVYPGVWTLRDALSVVRQSHGLPDLQIREIHDWRIQGVIKPATTFDVTVNLTPASDSYSVQVNVASVDEPIITGGFTAKSINTSMTPPTLSPFADGRTPPLPHGSDFRFVGHVVNENEQMISANFQVPEIWRQTNGLISEWMLVEALNQLAIVAFQRHNLPGPVLLRRFRGAFSGRAVNFAHTDGIVLSVGTGHFRTGSARTNVEAKIGDLGLYTGLVIGFCPDWRPTGTLAV